MTGQFATRRRADAFESLVEAPWRPSGPDAEAALLLGVVTQLRSQAELVHAATPRAAFTSELRSRLVAEAASAPAARPAVLTLPPRRHGSRERRTAVIATVAILLGGTAGMATASQKALPGEALYPVKRGVERVDLSLARSPDARGRDLLGQASTRLQETQSLVASGDAASLRQVPGTLGAFRTQEQRGADLVLDSYDVTGDRSDVAGLRTAAARHLAVLGSLAGRLPADAQPALVSAAGALRAIDSRADQTCSTCSDRPPLELPGLLSAAGEADRALLDASQVDLFNDHPFTAPRSIVRAARQRPGPGVAVPSGGASARPSGSPPAPASAGSSPLRVPATTSLPSLVPDLPPVLPTRGTGVGGVLGELGGGALSTVVPRLVGGTGLLATPTPH